MRIYSLNLASWLAARGYKYEICRDIDNGKCYFVFQENVSEAKEDYKRDQKLQDFLHTFKEMKIKMRNIKS